MKIAYESTIEEATDATFRMAELIGSLRTQMWSGLVVAPFIFIVLFLLIDEPVARLVLGVMSTALFVVYWFSDYKNRFRKRIRKMLVKALETDKPLPSEYELDENGLAFRKAGQEVRFAWNNVVAIMETANAFEVIMSPTGIAIIPKRIFSSSDQQRTWIVYIQEHTSREKLMQAIQ